MLEGQREAGDADEIPGPRVRGGQGVDGDLALGAEGRDEGALGARLDHHDADAGVAVGDRGRGDGDALGVERGPDQVAVRPGAVRAGVDALGAEAGGGDEHGHRAAGVVGRRGRHHVLPARGQVGHLDHDVDQGLAGVDDAAHGREATSVGGREGDLRRVEGHHVDRRLVVLRGRARARSVTTVIVAPASAAASAVEMTQQSVETPGQDEVASAR